MAAQDPKRRLALYRFFEDAWTDGLAAWLDQASRRSLEGWSAWLVVSSQLQGKWLRSRLLEQGGSVLGVRVLEPNSVRRELCHRAGLEGSGLGRTLLEFLLRVEIHNARGLKAGVLERGADQYLRALDELEVSGWLGDEHVDRLLPAVVRQFGRELEKTGVWTSALDRELAGRKGSCAKDPLTVCVAGWDTGNWLGLPLLQSIMEEAIDSRVYLPLPRSTAEGVTQDFVTALEERFRISHEICPPGGYTTTNEGLVDRLESADTGTPGGEPPAFLVGRTWRDQISLVRDHVIQRLTSSSGRLGIIVPQRGATSVAIVRDLEESGIRVYDDVGEKAERTPGQAVQRAAIEYHLEEGDVGALCRVKRALDDLGSEQWGDVDYEAFRDWLEAAFEVVQTRNSVGLAKLSREREWRGRRQPDPAVGEYILQLVQSLGELGEDGSWAELAQAWVSILGRLGVDADDGFSLPDAAETLLEGKSIPSGAFLEHLAARLSSQQVRRGPENSNPYARVVVTTLPAAQQQTWGSLVFLDSVEGEWPVQREENPFLGDRDRETLREMRPEPESRLPTTIEEARRDELRFLDAVGNCSGPICLAGWRHDPAKPASLSNPNEWALRCLLDRHESGRVADQWQRLTRRVSISLSSKMGPEIKHLSKVTRARRDPTKRFDDYLFNFGGAKLTQSPWSASRLDGAFATPATFALSHLLGVESRLGDSFVRAVHLVTGQLVHGWIAQLLRKQDTQDDLREAGRSGIAGLGNLVSAERMLLVRRLGGTGEIGIWWETVLQRAEWLARQCLQAVAEVEPGVGYLIEEPCRGSVETADGKLDIVGRMDLVTLNKPDFKDAFVNIIDFKTGTAPPPSLSTLSRDIGFQFAAYYLMAHALGAAGVEVGIIRPDVAKWDALTSGDLDDIRRETGRLARLQQMRVFGQNPPPASRDYETGEVLPLATVPIDADVLKAKHALLEEES